jgi:hypothetical protein
VERWAEGAVENSNKGMGGWRKLKNKELRDVYCSPNITRVIKEGKTCTPCGRHTRGLGGNTEGKRPLGRPRRTWDNTKMDIKDIGLGARTGLIWFKTGTSRGLLLL